MNVASLKLCKELYELSGWKDTAWLYDPWGQPVTLRSFGGELPAYDLGYMLRKLPHKIKQDSYRFTLMPSAVSWRAAYDTDDGEVCQSMWAETPEDAVAVLAIELFKQGALTKGGGRG